jgi:hypothetical protein
MKLSRFFALVLFGNVLCALADETVRTRIEAKLDATVEVAVGQPLTLRVDIWVTTWFLTAPQLPALDVPDALVTLSDESQHLNDTKGAQHWFGIERKYTITPMQGGKITIPAFTVIVKPGPSGKSMVLQTHAIDFTAKAITPPKTAGNSLVTTQLILTQKFDRDPAELKVGDSVTRTISMSASDTPAMLLPPVAFNAIEGLALYPAPPLISNKTGERGAFIGGERIDAVTYIVQRAGNYELPAVDIAWWNPRTQALQHSTLPAVKIHAAGAPMNKSEFGVPAEVVPLKRNFHWHRYAVLAAMLALVLILLRWLSPILLRTFRLLAHKIQKARENYRESERYAYHKFEKAIIGHNPAEIYAALCAWIERLPARYKCSGPQAFASMIDDQPLSLIIDSLQHCLYDSTSDWNSAKANILKRLIYDNRRLIFRKTHSHRNSLSAMNPI